jgi:hypothetical protein
MTQDCPRCGEPAQVRRWFDDYRLVETDIKCPSCGYHYNWSYGKETIEEGDTHDE